MILVAGGTGRLGTEVVRGLCELNEPVRVLTRDPSRTDPVDRVELVVGDVRDPATVSTAARGADVIVSAMHGFAGPGHVTPETVDVEGNRHLVDAAATEGCRMVLVSVSGAAPDSPMELFRAKFRAEDHLRRSGVPATIVRSPAFLEMWVDLLTETAGRSGRPVVFGRGDQPIQFAHVADVAAAVIEATQHPVAGIREVEVAPAETMSFNHLADSLQGVDGSTRHVPRPVLRVMAAVLGRIKPDLARQARAALVMDTTDLTIDATAP